MTPTLYNLVTYKAKKCMSLDSYPVVVRYLCLVFFRWTI